MSFEDREYAWYEERASLLRALEESERANEFLRSRERAFREKEALLLAERNRTLRTFQRVPGLYESKQSAEESRKERAREALNTRTLQLKVERAEARASQAERALKQRDSEANGEVRELRERINVLEGRLALLGTLRSFALSVDVTGGLAGAPVAAQGGVQQLPRRRTAAVPPPPPPTTSSSGSSKSPSLDSTKKPFHVIAPAGMRNTPFVKGLESAGTSTASGSSSSSIKDIKDGVPLSPSPTMDLHQPVTIKSGRKSPTSSSSPPSSSSSSSSSSSPSSGSSGDASKSRQVVPPPPVLQPPTSSFKPKSSPGRMLLGSPQQGKRGAVVGSGTPRAAAAPSSPFSSGADHSPDKFKQRVKEFMLSAMGMEPPLPPQLEGGSEGGGAGEEGKEGGSTGEERQHSQLKEEEEEEEQPPSAPQPEPPQSVIPERVWGGIRVKTMVIKREPPVASEGGGGGGAEAGGNGVPPPPMEAAAVGGSPALWSKYRAGDSDGQIKSYGM